MEKKSVGLLELETAVLECFLEKTPLNPLGVKSRYSISSSIRCTICCIFLGYSLLFYDFHFPSWFTFEGLYECYFHILCSIRISQIDLARLL
jgi:hypothetical protein